MPGQVTRVLIAEGDPVQRGQPLIILEAMKMEIKIAAPHDGRVAKVLVKPGQVVERGQALIEISTDD
jgi:biotin carboxyl carrier protein